jgi:hypothetical protein
MEMQIDPDLLADEMLFADDADAPLDEWTLDEFERGTDFGSLRPTWMNSDEQNE